MFNDVVIMYNHTISFFRCYHSCIAFCIYLLTLQLPVYLIMEELPGKPKLNLPHL